MIPTAHDNIFADVKVYETEIKTHVAIVFLTQAREKGSLDFNSLVNQVSRQTRFGLASATMPGTLRALLVSGK